MTNIYTAQSHDKGRGVFAAVPFSRGDIIELCPVLVLSPDDRKVIHNTALHDYYFVWGEGDEQAVIALGYGSLYNHSARPNAQFVNDYDNELIIIECLTDITLGEEISINYIDQASREKLWFEISER